MSKIEKLAIAGIRSFSPSEEARIEFLSPLTLILGQNGCGKTTIIEALKYITTGDVPPGCGKGASFVNDSKLESNVPWIKAQVRILMKDTRGQKIKCMRLLEAVHSAKKIELKTLDATITRCNPDGTTNTLTSKCADFQAEMAVLLGVSKPILQNVIFCHQEDSNWPLDEGKKVKDKFDAIFSATRYIKSLETIRKLRVEMKKELKQNEEILKVQLKWKEEADRKKSELATNIDDVKIIEVDIEDKEGRMVPIKSRLVEIDVVEKNLSEYSRKIGGKEAELNTLVRAQEEHQRSLSAPITCSDHELLDMILNFDRQLKEKENTVKQAEAKVVRLESEINRYKKEESKEVEKLGLLKASHTSHLGTVENQNVKLKMICEKFGFTAYKGHSEFTNEDTEDILQLLTVVITDKKVEVQSEKTKFEERERAIQEEISKVRIKEATLDHDIKKCNEMEHECKNKIRNIERTIFKTKRDVSDANVTKIEEDIEFTSNKLQTQENSLDINKMNTEIKGLRAEERTAEEKLDEIKIIINKMNRQVDFRAKYESRMKDLKENKNKVQMLLSKCSDELEHIFDGEIPEENLKSKLNAYAADLHTKLNDIRSNEKNLNRRKTQLDTKIQSQEKELSLKETECKALDQKIQGKTGGSTLEQVLEKSKAVIEEKGKDEGQLSSSVTILNGYVNKLRQRSCCPLCHRDFEDVSAKNDLIEELETKVQNIPSKLQAVKTEVQKQKKLHDEIIELKPQRERFNKLIKECDTLKSHLEKDKQEFRKVLEELEDVSEIKNLSLSDEEIVKTLQPDVAIIENTQRKIKEITEDVDSLQLQLGSDEEGMSREEALSQESELNKTLKTLRQQREEKSTQLESHKSSLEVTKNKLMTLKQQHLDMKNKLQELETLKNEKQNLEEQITSMCEKRERAKVEVAPLKAQIKDQEIQKMNAIKDKESWLETENDKVAKINERYRGIQDRHKTILGYIDSRGEERLKETEAKVESLGDITKSKEEEKKRHETQVKEIQKELTTQIKEKHALDEEKKYRDKEIEVAEIKKEIESLNEKVKSFNGETLREEKMNLSRKWQSLNNKVLELQGQKKEKQSRIDLLKRELLHKDFRNAEKSYKENLIKIKCTEVATDDLNKYFKALDTSIMKFHNEKMTIINRIIRELWRSTYKGNDIDTIEIKTDETESLGADRRRTYHYRVVMKKNEKDMDMRGRCSAGQKVLASLIIRIALAETFSSNCGILALDEPTTNLDRENIGSLAEALLSIVRRRSSQKNFQLIVITHDEEFLQILTRADYLEYFYQLSRDERGLSKITKHRT